MDLVILNHCQAVKTIAEMPFLRSSNFHTLRQNSVCTSLHPPYEGPYPVIKRHEKYFDISIKGVSRTISMDRLKPCFFADPDPSKPTLDENLQLQALLHQLCQLLYITHNRALLSNLQNFDAGEPSSIQRMNSSVVATLVCVLVALTLVEGRRPPPRGPSPGVKALIPACLPFSNAVEERIRDVEDELSRPRDCPEENIEECIRRDVNIIRCGLKEKPSEECIDQIVSFLQNDKCTE
ncbi:uncharacterized protein TNCV_1794181 [Trichonephila clavipes]|nr:uncharacterized protein TNCV_1794181 [Trichonephila clavipes]